MRQVLPVTYFSQRDNVEKPNYSCFPTSLAMCIDYLLQESGKMWKDVVPAGMQLEDYINSLINDDETTAWLKDNVVSLGAWIMTATRRENWYLEAFIFERIMKKHGYCAKYKQIKYADYCSQIDKRFPVVIGGNFSSTSRIGAHVVCGIGYDKMNNSLIVNDPFGDARAGYPKGLTLGQYDASGRGVGYPNRYFKNGVNFSSILVSKV